MYSIQEFAHKCLWSLVLLYKALNSDPDELLFAHHVAHVSFLHWQRQSESQCGNDILALGKMKYSALYGVQFPCSSCNGCPHMHVHMSPLPKDLSDQAIVGIFCDECRKLGI